MINFGDIIIIELKNSESSEKYRCKLVDRNGNNLYIDYPTNTVTNKTAFLLDGTQLKCSFVDKEGVAYLFDSEVLRRIKQNIPMLVLSYPGSENLVKIQRRQYVRVETSVDIAIHSNNLDFPPFTTVTDDISAGGVAVVVPKNTPLRQGMIFQIWLVLPFQNGDYHYMKVEGKVVRIIEMNETSFKIPIEFLDISSHDRQMLLRFCFDRQLVIKKKKAGI